MTTSTERKIYTELWALDLLTRVSELNTHVDTTPIMAEGTNPLQDTEDSLDTPGEIYYFYYSKKKYPSSYWSGYLRTIKSSQHEFRFCVTDADRLNQTLGITSTYVPKVWVLAIEAAIKKNPHSGD